MAEGRFRYKGSFRRNANTATGLDSINPEISGMMFPTAYNAINSREWVDPNKK